MIISLLNRLNNADKAIRASAIQHLKLSPLLGPNLDPQLTTPTTPAPTPTKKISNYGQRALRLLLAVVITLTAPFFARANPRSGEVLDTDSSLSEKKESVDSYTEALYSALIEINQNSPKSSDLKEIQSFNQRWQDLVNSRIATPMTVKKEYEAATTSMTNKGAKGCLDFEYGTRQMELIIKTYFKTPFQQNMARAAIGEIQEIRKMGSCLSPSYNEGAPVNITAQVSYLNALLKQGLNPITNPLHKETLSNLFKTYTATFLQGLIDSHFFNLHRIQNRFAKEGLPFQHIEDIKSEAFKQDLLAKAKVSAVFIAGLSGFLTAFFGSGLIVEKGILASSHLTQKWNRWMAPLLSKWSGGRLRGKIQSLEKASYIFSSATIGALGGASLQTVTLAADTLKEASVAQFAKDSTLGAELIPTIKEMMNKDKIVQGLQNGAGIGFTAGSALTLGVFEYNLPKPLKPNSIRHAVLTVLSAAVLYSTAMSGKELLQNLIEGQKALAESDALLGRLSQTHSSTEEIELLRQSKLLKVKAFDAFGEAALAGLDLTILVMLVNELFIRGELYHIWNAHESKVVDAVARGSDEIPGAANNITQNFQAPSPSDLAATKSSKLLSTMGDDAAKISGAKGGSMANVADDLSPFPALKAAKLTDSIDDLTATGILSSKTAGSVPPIKEDLRPIPFRVKQAH